MASHAPIPRWTCAWAPGNLRLLGVFLPACVLKKGVACFLLYTAPIEEALVVFGGRSDALGKPDGHLREVAAYDGSAWIQLPQLEAARVGAAAVFFNDRFILTGGYCAREPLRDVQYLSIHEMLWKKFPDMNNGRYGHAAAVVGNRWLYVMGGETDAGSGSCERLDLEKPVSFENFQQPMPQPVAGCRAFAVGHKLFVVGGVVLGWGPRRASDAIQVLDTKRETWSVHPVRLKQGRAAFGLVVEFQSLLLSGGFAVGDGVEQELASTERVSLVLDEAAAEAEKAPELPSPRGGCQSVVCQQKAVTVGGEAPSTGTVKSDSLQLTPDGWTREGIPRLITGRTAFAACVGRVWPREYHDALIFDKFDF